jgi:CRISPR-associated endonuclease/helicase Cas3
MLVTFISQCEKKALARTRRVLDAFADRIGSNAWQTVITEDGLIAVKNLLRKTATKNTAVACHWARSRSRTDLVWVVGSKDRFNLQGVVPVNTTQKEVFMDTKFLKPVEGVLYANTHLQPLVEHLFAIGYVAEQFFIRLIGQDNLANTTFLAGCFHDLGKIDPQFQSWVINPKRKTFVAEDGQHIDDTKFSFDHHPRHNELSLLLYNLLDRKELKTVNSNNKLTLKHVLLWHHAKPYRKKDDYTNYGHIYNKFSTNLKVNTFADFYQSAVDTIKAIQALEQVYKATESSQLLNCIDQNYDEDDISSLRETNLPAYKSYDLYESFEKYRRDIHDNAINNIVRACVITSDRLISKLDAHALSQHIKKKTLDTLLDEALENSSNLVSHIEQALTHFGHSERSQKQNEVAVQLAKLDHVGVLAGAAGCGKTKIALEWAKLKNVQKIIWICPRVQVCQGLFDELRSDQYLPNANIEILTGEFKFTNDWDSPTKEEDYFSGDIVITTIDQIFSAIITHSKVDGLIDYLNSHIVFDEYHEYVNMPAFNLLFAELVECKKRQTQNTNTLLVSATPHYLFLEELLDIQRNQVVVMPSFNQSLYRIKLETYDEEQRDDSNPLYRQQTAKAFVISNTAQTAQLSYIRNQTAENSILFHSKFKRSDKKYLFEEIYESFKNNGNEKYQILRSGPIVQASLNISCDVMVSELSTAENTLQRLGRLDRFGRNTDVNELTLAIPKSIADGKGTGKSARFLARNNVFASTRVWYDLLSQLEDKPLKLPQIYALYQDLYALDKAKKSMTDDLMASLKKSVGLINRKVIDPIVIPSKKKDAQGQAKMSKNSLRGENVFVQMAIINVDDPAQPKFVNQYAYDFPIRDDEPIDNLTASTDEVTGYEDSGKNLVANMFKKHHNIMGGVKPFKDYVLLNDARSSEFPIYLSYTSNDLDAVGGESARHSEAIYYAVCEKQPIGAIGIKLLLDKKD